ncbi:MAG TPA: rod shape-determining protein MreC [bacterium]|nr:rod shape-determining protein MreC [bacterium]
MTGEKRLLAYLVVPVVLAGAVAVWADLTGFEPLTRLRGELAGARAELALLGGRWSRFFSGEEARLEEASREAEFALSELTSREDREENRRLRAELGLRLRSPWRLLTVELTLTIPPTLAAGEDRGVAPGQAVLVDGWLAGVVGRVVGDTAELVPLGDPRLRLGVRLERTRRTGVLVSREGGLWIDYLSADVLPEDDELVVTSGLGALPPGVPVGRVSEVGWEPGALELTCRIEPAAEVAGAGFAHIILR